MSDPYSTEAMFDALEQAKAKKAAVTAKSQPLRDERDKLLAQMAPLVEKERDLIKRYREIEAPLYEIDMNISALSRALSGKSDPRKAAAATAEPAA